MKYFVDFQYATDGASRPRDQGEVMPLEVSRESGISLLPSVGDYVNIQNGESGERASFRGKVRSRLFSYFGFDETEPTCAVHIVVEDTNDDWGLLLKE